MHSTSDNTETMTDDEADVTENILISLLNKYQNNLEKSMKGSQFVFDYVHLLYYKSHKIYPNRR